MIKIVLKSFLLSSLLFLGSCAERTSENNPSAQDEFSQINYGEAMCEFEGEVIDEFRYGGKIETTSGEELSFMSVECLAGYYLNNLSDDEVNQMWVTDYNHGKRLIPVGEAVFLHSMNRRSPNGLNLTALEASDEKITYNMRFAFGGELIGWSEVLELVSSEWGIEQRQQS